MQHDMFCDASVSVSRTLVCRVSPNSFLMSWMNPWRYTVPCPRAYCHFGNKLAGSIVYIYDLLTCDSVQFMDEAIMHGRHYLLKHQGRGAGGVMVSDTRLALGWSLQDARIRDEHLLWAIPGYTLKT